MRNSIPIRRFAPRWIESRPWPPRRPAPATPADAQVAELRRIATEALNQRDAALARLRQIQGT